MLGQWRRRWSGLRVNSDSPVCRHRDPCHRANKRRRGSPVPPGTTMATTCSGQFIPDTLERPGTEWHIRRLTRYPTTAPTASTQQMSQHVSYPETKNPLLEPQAPANQRHPSPKPNSGPSSQSASSIPSPTSRYFRTSTNSLLTCGSRNQSESGSIAVWLYV